MSETAPIVMVCTSDLAGQTRGKGAPAARLDAVLRDGIGWTPTNSMITAFGQIAPSPWAALGDLVLAPVEAARFDVTIDGATRETIFLADIETPDGAPWAVCPRGFAKRMLAALEARHGLKLKAAFEHEFVIEDGSPPAPNGSYALGDVRARAAFAEKYLAALAAAGAQPDSFMAEFAPNQYEIVVGAAMGIGAADRAVATREIARAVAASLDARACFAPILAPDGVGNGVHLHFSLADAASGVATNWDASAPHAIDRRAGAFIAGVLSKLPAIAAVTAAGVVSYYRLAPDRWSATHANLGQNDREAAVRICPVFDRRPASTADQFHFEYRVADAAASPHMLLGAIVAAGLWGLDQNLPTPTPRTGKTAVQSAGVAPLPASLEAALDALDADAELKGAMGEDLHAAYIAHKRFEADLMRPLSPQNQCARYGEVY